MECCEKVEEECGQAMYIARGVMNCACKDHCFFMKDNKRSELRSVSSARATRETLVVCVTRAQCGVLFARKYLSIVSIRC